MIKQGFNDDILEKKYKILRTSIMLGNIRNREEVFNTFEQTARDVDNLRTSIFEELLAGKMYTTTTLEEEAKRLEDLIGYIEHRINERNDFVNDYIKITANFLDGLPNISAENELSEYRLRLANIHEYLNNSKEIEDLNSNLKKLRDELAEKYQNKANNEIINSKLEDELIEDFNKIIASDDYYSSLNYMDIDAELVKIEGNLRDKAEVMNTFMSSYNALRDAGISGAEREEYLSYVGDAKKEYYNELEKKYILNIYKLVLDKQSEYEALYQKREEINRILAERLSKRNELDIYTQDELEHFEALCNEQFSIIKAQRINIEKIENLIQEIANCESRLEELDIANSREEIVKLLEEYSVDKQTIEKIELPVEQEIQEEVIKQNELTAEKKPDNMVVKISEPIRMNVRMASDTAKLIMKKVVIVLEPKKFNGKREKIVEAERELEERKRQEEMLKSAYQPENVSSDIFVTMDVNNETADSSDDIFINTDNQVATEIVIEDATPKSSSDTKPQDLFSETDPFLDDNEFEKNDKEKEEKLTVMPEIKNIGTVKPTSVLTQIEAMNTQNDDIILPTMGLTNNEKVDVPIV